MNLSFTVSKTFTCSKEIDFSELMGLIESSNYTDKFLAGLWKLAKANPDSFDIEELDSDDFPVLLDDDVEGLAELVEKHYPADNDLWSNVAEETALDQGEIDYCAVDDGVDDISIDSLDCY